jgi:hypothetical protein
MKKIQTFLICFLFSIGTTFAQDSLQITLWNENNVLADRCTTFYGDTSQHFYVDEVTLADAFKFRNILESIGVTRHGAFLAIERRAYIGSEVGPTDTSYLRIEKLGVYGRKKYQMVLSTRFSDHAKSGVLQDLFLGTEVPINLRGVTSFDFTVSKDSAGSVDPNRFRIVLFAKEVFGVVRNTSSISGVSTFSISPNLVKSQGAIMLRLNANDNGKYIVKIVNNFGQPFLHKVYVARGAIAVTLPSMPTGMYQVSLGTVRGTLPSKPLMVVQ